ncbi:hypothetical protein [Neomoorella humiferrea]|uniref:Uncharacterized protein n=1 Tax=Neomoorella humiferrea TaxID=676965 RepID=A0A2T0AT89_9FIRM|nr:hypothetical protein [Moorella humiferrea]PRR73611.1 hypothetical protein MOHU_11460 [Moorella humiferrea]
MAETKASAKKSKKLWWNSTSLLLMLLAPPVLLYPGAKGNPGLEILGYIILIGAMLIPLLN